MFKTFTFKTTLLTTVIGAVSFTIPASATITFDGSGAASNTFQQTLNNPCVIGDPSCKEPSGMTYFSSSGPTDPYDFFSPVYQAMNPFTTFSGNLIPTTFTIGVDDNLSTGAGLEILQAFNVYSCTNTNVNTCNTLLTANSYTGPTNIPNNNNGNGFSDATLKGFSLTSGNFYRFEAKVSNDTDGMEEFFIIQNGSNPVPEPVTSALIGTGLLSLALLRRRIRG
jgi:hypothetical protein